MPMAKLKPKKNECHKNTNIYHWEKNGLEKIFFPVCLIWKEDKKPKKTLRRYGNQQLFGCHINMKRMNKIQKVLEQKYNLYDLAWIRGYKNRKLSCMYAYAYSNELNINLNTANPRLEVNL